MILDAKAIALIKEKAQEQTTQKQTPPKQTPKQTPKKCTSPNVMRKNKCVSKCEKGERAFHGQCYRKV